MGYTVNWYQKDTIIHLTLSGAISLDDVDQSSQAVIAHMDASSADQTFILADISGITVLQFTAHQMLAVESLAQVPLHHRFGWTAYYDDANPFTRFLATLLSKSRVDRSRVFPDMGAAVAFLHLRGAKLDESV